MLSTSNIRRLDEVNSILVDLARQGEASAVLQTLASVIGQLEVLDKPANDPHYWHAVVLNLNTVADTCQREELDAETMYGSELGDEDWELSEQLFDETLY